MAADVHLGHASGRDARGQTVLPEPDGLAEGFHEGFGAYCKPWWSTRTKRWKALRGMEGPKVKHAQGRLTSLVFRRCYGLNVFSPLRAGLFRGLS